MLKKSSPGEIFERILDSLTKSIRMVVKQFEIHRKKNTKLFEEKNPLRCTPSLVVNGAFSCFHPIKNLKKSAKKK